MVPAALAPGASVKGRVKPVTLNPAPVTDNCETFKVAVPLLRSVSGCVLVVPVVTLAKATLVGVTVRTGCIPVPLSADEAPGALLVTVSEPVVLPAAAGAKLTDPLALVPGASVRGKVNPVALNPAPVVATPETTRLAFPVF
jgi:hypothetical protein